MVLPSRFFKNKFRWFGLILAVTSVAILSSANISTQWVGWSFSVIACVMWIYFGLKDKDLKIITFQENDNGFNIFSNMNITPTSISFYGNLNGNDSLEFISYEYDLLVNFFTSNDVLTLLSSKVNAKFRIGFDSVDPRLNDLIFSNKIKKFKEFEKEFVKYLNLIK